MSTYRVSKKAQSDIRSIAHYTQEQWGAAQRRKYLESLEGKFRQLADMPLMAAERKDLEPPVRIHRHERHLIVYMVIEDGILIIRVRHHSEDWENNPT